MANPLPFEFNEIINYSNLSNLETTFLGYTYNAKSNKIKVDVGNFNNYKNKNNMDDLIDILHQSKKTTKDVEKIKTDINELKSKNEELQNKFNNKSYNDANINPIIAGKSNTVNIDHRGIYSHEVDNSNRGIRIINGTLGITGDDDDDFEPIITPDGINPRYLPSGFNINANGNGTNQIGRVVNNKGNGQGSTESDGGNSGGTTNVTNIINPKIKYVDLPCKIIRDVITNKVIRIEYYKDGQIEYVDEINRNASGKVDIIKTTRTGKEIETSTINRNPTTGKVEGIDVVYENEDRDYTYAGMK